MGCIDLDYLAKTNDEWKSIMAEKLETAEWFEIHCWSDEAQEIKTALKFGKVKPSSWRGGTIIEGLVTKEFKSHILSTPKPTDTEIYNKMTPFFTIHLSNGFWSEHYGTELNEED